MTPTWLGVTGAAALLGGAATAALLLAGAARSRLDRRTARLDAQLRGLFLASSGRSILAAQVVAAAVLVYLAVDEDVRFAIALPAVHLAPGILIEAARRRRTKRIEEQLDAWLAMMANMLKVTGSLADAISHSVDLVRGPLGQELDLLLKELRVGAPLPDALRTMAQRVRSDILSTVVTILLLGRVTGGELPSLLTETAAALRERLRLEGVVRKQTAMGRMQLVVLFLAPPFIVYTFHEVDPTFFDPLTHGGFLGQLICAAAALLWVGSLMMARRILKVDI